MARPEDFFIRHQCGAGGFDSRYDICPPCRKRELMEKEEISEADIEELVFLEYLSGAKPNEVSPAVAYHRQKLKEFRHSLFG